jgi:hypothetical protein
MRYDIDKMTVMEALEVPEIVKIVDKHYPGATRHPLLFLVKRKTLPEVLKMTPGADQERIRRIREDISRL